MKNYPAPAINAASTEEFAHNCGFNLAQIKLKIKQLAAGGKLILGEADFANGLNFLTILRFWRKHKPNNTVSLHYISSLLIPLAPNEFHRRLAEQEILKHEAAELTQQYYLMLAGHQRMIFTDNVELTIVVGASLTESDFPATSDFILDKPSCSEPLTKSTPPAKPWLAKPVRETSPKEVAIIGAGISGAATAYSLARRGYQVKVYESNAQAAQEASGNYQAILYGSWSGFAGAMMELTSSSYRYTHHLIKQLLTKNHDYAECGVIQLAHNQQQLTRNQHLLHANLAPDLLVQVDQSAIEALAQTAISHTGDGLYFPHGMWLDPRSLVTKLLQHPNIQLICNCEVTKINYQAGQWQLFDKAQLLITTSPILVLCNAYAANQFAQTRHLAMRKIRGQISIVPQPNKLATVLCGGGYITPSFNGKFTLGATFKFADNSREIRPSEHQENLATAESLISELISTIQPQELQGQVNFRTSSYDYLPLVGPIADYTKFRQDYAQLRLDKNYRINTPCSYLPNLYLNIAQGAKGMLTAPYAGEIIANYLENTQLPCSEHLRQALHPNRFYAKDLSRNKI